MKNKTPLFFILPGIAVAVVVGVALILKMVTPKPSSVVPAEFPNAMNSQTGNPNSYLGGLFGNNTVTPTPTPATANDLSTELKNTYDDGGASDLNALGQQANGL